MQIKCVEHPRERPIPSQTDRDGWKRGLLKSITLLPIRKRHDHNTQMGVLGNALML